MLVRMWHKGYAPQLLLGVQTCTTTLKINLAVSQKIWNSSTSRPSLLFLGIYSKDALPNHKDICSTMFIATLFIIARNWKQCRCSSTKEWINKMWCIYTMKYCSVIKNQWHHEICRQIDGTRKDHSEWGNPDLERQI